MPSRDSLHALVDDLAEQELVAAKRYLHIGNAWRQRPSPYESVRGGNSGGFANDKPLAVAAAR